MGLARPITGLVASRGLLEVDRAHPLAPRLFWLAGHRGALIDELAQRRHVLKGSTNGALAPTVGGLAARAVSGFAETLQPPSSNAALGINDKISIVWIGQRNGTAGGIVPFGRPHASAPGSPYADFTFYCSSTYMECRFTNTGGSTTTAGGFFTIYPAPEIWVATWDGTNIALYQNGVSVATGSLAGPVADSTGKGISTGDSGTTIPWDFIAASVYNRALTAGEVLALSRAPYQFLRPLFPPQFKAASGGTQSGALSVSGVATASFTGASTAAATVSIAGLATAAFTGATTAAADLAIAGVATASFAGVAFVDGAIGIAGVASVSFAGATTAASVVGMAGVATASFAGETTAAGAITAAGIAAGAFVGQEVGGGVESGALSISGVAAVAFVGASTAEGAFTIAGAGAAGFVAPSVAEGVFSASGAASVGFVSLSPGGVGAYPPIRKRRRVKVGAEIFWDDQRAAIAAALERLRAASPPEADGSAAPRPASREAGPGTEALAAGAANDPVLELASAAEFAAYEAEMAARESLRLRNLRALTALLLTEP